MSPDLLAQANLLNNASRHWPQLAMLVGIAIFCFVLMRRGNLALRRGRSRDDASETEKSPRETNRDAALDDAPPEVLRWQVELHDTARDLKGELDSKILIIESLLKEVRAERERLEAVLARTKSA